MQFFEIHSELCTTFNIPWQAEKVDKSFLSYKCHAHPSSIPTAERTHLWLVDVSKLDSFDFENVLSNDEKKKLDGLINLQQRASRKLARVALRQVLARYLKIPPLAIEFDYNDAGKPMLNAKHGSKLLFNLSHARDKVAILINSDLPVGVDIEYDNPSEKVVSSIAKRFFNAKEYELVSQAIKADKLQVFNQLWTMKEAMIKAKGLTVYSVLDTPDLSVFDKHSVAREMQYFQLPGWLGFNLRQDQFHLTAVLSLS